MNSILSEAIFNLTGDGIVEDYEFAHCSGVTFVTIKTLKDILKNKRRSFRDKRRFRAFPKKVSGIQMLEASKILATLQSNVDKSVSLKVSVNSKTRMVDVKAIWPYEGVECAIRTSFEIYISDLIELPEKESEKQRFVQNFFLAINKKMAMQDKERQMMREVG